MEPIASPEILEQFKTGDRLAFELIYRQYADKVYRFASRYIRNNEDPEEVVQDVFIRLWNVRESVNSGLNFDNYLFTITKNLIFNQHRHKINEVYFQTVLLASIEQEHISQENEIIAEDLSRYIDKIIMGMPPKQQEIFNLSRKQLLPYKEIALQLDISEKTVEAHIHKALKTIRQQLRRENIYMIFF